MKFSSSSKYHNCFHETYHFFNVQLYLKINKLLQPVKLWSTSTITEWNDDALTFSWNNIAVVFHETKTQAHKNDLHEKIPWKIMVKAHERKINH